MVANGKNFTTANALMYGGLGVMIDHLLIILNFIKITPSDKDGVALQRQDISHLNYYVLFD